MILFVIIINNMNIHIIDKPPILQVHSPAFAAFVPFSFPNSKV